MARCQQMAMSNTHQPQFITGMYMAAHQKSEVIADIVVSQKNTVEINTQNTQPATIKINDDVSKVISKNNQVEIKDTLSGAVNETDSVENKDTVAIALTNPAPVQIKETYTTNVTDPVSKEGLFEEPLDPLISKYAEMISVDPVDINNYPLYRFIDQWYGTRYRWGGEDNTGIDCSAFSQKLYGKVYSIDLYRTAKQQHRNCERIKDPEDAEEGDLVFFRIHHFRVSHVGVYLANGYFVHASRSQGVVISNLNSKYWHRRYAGCGRIEKEDKATYESDSLE
ncbi:MAG: C40 family peptidase, partial [Chitinophagales bacterium]